MVNKIRHIGDITTFALIIVATTIRAAIIDNDAINSGYYRSDGDLNASFNSIITGPLRTEIVNNAEVVISGTIDTTTAPAADRYSDIDMQNQGLCDTRNNPVWTDSLHEDSDLREICDSSSREYIDNTHQIEEPFASSLRTATTQELIFNHHTQKPWQHSASEIKSYNAYKNINKLGFGYKVDNSYLKEVRSASSLRTAITRKPIFYRQAQKSWRNNSSERMANHEDRYINTLGFGSSSGNEGSGTSNSVVIMVIILVHTVIFMLAIGWRDVTKKSAASRNTRSARGRTRESLGPKRFLITHKTQ